MKKSLNTLAEELERSVEVIDQIVSGIICPTCKKAQMLHADLISIKYNGECASCDHVRSDIKEGKV